MGQAHPPRESDELPVPEFNDGIWMVSCRPTSRMSKFSDVTLLFRPDMRLFCPNGVACALRSGPGGDRNAHSDLFFHADKALIAQGSTDATECVNDPGVHVSIPWVEQCWNVPEHGRLPFPPQLADGQGRTAVLYIHGFRQRYYRVTSVASHLHHRLSRSVEAQSIVVMPFLWPCRSHKAAYLRARASAEEAAPRLARVVADLKERGFRVVLVAHSLGCRVALRALLEPAGGNVEADACLLLAGALPSTVLSPTGEFPRARLHVPQLDVLFSAHDEVLGASFSAGETAAGNWNAAALGQVGVDGAVPEGCASIDVSSSVPSHNPNAWLLSPAVGDRLRRSVGAVEEDEEWESGELCDSAEEVWESDGDYSSDLDG